MPGSRGDCGSCPSPYHFASLVRTSRPVGLDPFWLAMSSSGRSVRGWRHAVLTRSRTMRITGSAPRSFLAILVLALATLLAAPSARAGVRVVDNRYKLVTVVKDSVFAGVRSEERRVG